MMTKRLSATVLRAAFGAAAASLLFGMSSGEAWAVSAWAPDTYYTAGTIVSYNGNDYQALVNQTDYSSTGWNPTTASLWTLVGPDSGSGGGTGSTGGTGGTGGTTTGTAAGFIYSPYKDTSISMNWNTNTISTNVTGQLSPVLSILPTGVRALTLAFATGECGSESWAGLGGSTLASSNVSLFTAKNVNYVISTGGASGVFTCGTDAGMTTFINRYASNNLVGIDFDIEGGQTQAIINNLVQRVVAAQKTYPNLRFSFTLATVAPAPSGASQATSWGASAPDSFNTYGDWVMQAIQTYGLKNYTINLMTMDYGSALPGNCVLSGGACQMGQSTVQAALNLHDHWGVPYSQIEVTPMIGGNDSAGETFTPSDVDTVSNFVKQNGLAGLHFWSFDRDADCAPGAASPTCNTIGGVGALGYTNHFASDLGQ
ncbi:glycosyl hydrolase [Paraburkholderia acidicola]|uniref:Glycosyl hydrolase n=1 Tax=Paraburkholderia acidicola TaxID=1912599 RepID=A0A2A4F3F1_9BURK|nr:carbohydrate-binding protein [Paraburkholderia acidicola]PCE27497.1 glycosyl hydrolase [Paraburkholderia acidicola]